MPLATANQFELIGTRKSKFPGSVQVAGKKADGSVHEIITFPGRGSLRAARAFIRGMAFAEGKDPMDIKHFNVFSDEV